MSVYSEAISYVWVVTKNKWIIVPMVSTPSPRLDPANRYSNSLHCLRHEQASVAVICHNPCSLLLQPLASTPASSGSIRPTLPSLDLSAHITSQCPPTNLVPLHNQLSQNRDCGECALHRRRHLLGVRDGVPPRQVPVVVACAPNAPSDAPSPIGTASDRCGIKSAVGICGGDGCDCDVRARFLCWTGTDAMT
jgi:hypothetical protein